MIRQGPEYSRVAGAVLRACRDLAEDFERRRAGADEHDPRGRPSYRLVRGYHGTCYGVVRAFDSDSPVTLVVGQLVTGPAGCGVKLCQVPVEGGRVLAALAQASDDLDEYTGSCTCGHELLLGPGVPGAREADLDYVCPACRFRPLRPKRWRG